MDKILKGILRYTHAGKAKFLNDMDNLSSNAIKRSTVFFGCIDSRVLNVNLVRPDSGEVFFVQNAGNMIPHYAEVAKGQMSTEAGALELCCVLNGIRNVVVCGHSDCKAICALYYMRHNCDPEAHHPKSPLKSWVCHHGRATVDKCVTTQPDEHGGKNIFHFQIGGKDVRAVIDPGNKLAPEDRFSQLHALQQASHVSSYPFLKPLIEAGELTINILWFDIHSGNMFMFRPSLERYEVLNEDNISELLVSLTERESISM